MIRGCALTSLVAIILAAFFAPFALSQTDVSPSCPPCNEALCPPFNNAACSFGVVTDRCRCCFECARGPREQCSNQRDGAGHYYGQCGSGMECRKRVDLNASFQEEWMCYCLSEREVCGEDGESYDNQCLLTAASKKFGRTIIIKHYGVCRRAPEIVSPPEHMTESVGSWITMSCEAEGYPIPEVRWEYRHGELRRILPGGDPRIAVNSRGGPDKYQTTGFLQIMDLTNEHEGDYVCVAFNQQGASNMSARLFVNNDKEIKVPLRPVHLSEAPAALQSEHRPKPIAFDTRPKRTIEYINSMHYEDFVDSFGNVIENCNLCAASVWGLRPFTDSKDLQIKMTSFIDALPGYGQEGILRGFAGMRALVQPQFGWSTSEQQTLEAADERYKRRFGFPLIISSSSPNTTFKGLLAEANSRVRMGMMEELKRGIEIVKNITVARICDIIDGDNDSSGDFGGRTRYG